MDGNNPFGSSPRQNLDDVFADLTNQDPDPEPEPEMMENTHANEALEVLDASNSGEHSASPEQANDEAGEKGMANGNANGREDAARNAEDDF